MVILSTEVLWFLSALGLLILGYLTYSYVTFPYGYWEKQGIPFVPARSILRNLLLFYKTPLQEIQVEFYKKYGRLYGAFEGNKPTLVVADPDLLRQILVKDFQYFPQRRTFDFGDPLADSFLTVVHGERWKRIRSIVSPAFSTGKMKRMTDIIVNSAKSVTQNFAENVGQPVNSKKLFESFAMDVIASAAFATKLDAYQDPNNVFIQQARKIFTRNISWRFLLFILLPKVARLFRVNPFVSEPMSFFKQLTLDIIEERNKSGKVGNDFLQLLMDAEKESREQEKESTTEIDKNAADLGHEEENSKIFKISSKNRYMSRDELIAQCIIFFLAGFDTIATTLALASYALALNPDVQDILSKEVDDIIRKNNGKLTYDAIQEMKYLDNVIYETLRMFPPAIISERKADADYKLGDTGVIVKKDMMVGIPVYAMHHDPEFYPEPEKFKPERFTHTEKAQRNPYVFLAFGAGPRNCVGMRFALMELKICLAYMISQLKIERCSETKVPLEMSAGVGLLQPKEVMLSFEKKESRTFDGLEVISK